ncbi:MAG: hypothetical protein IJ486_01005 [Firmicutes bacterium]|nr:hypothetical protein [Bacillota bacterium]
MRRDFAIMLALLIAAVGVVPWAHGTVNEAKDQVEIRETILYGDSFWAEGLEVGFNSKLKDQIFWDTTFWPGTDRVEETEYRYYLEGSVTSDTDAWKHDVTVRLVPPGDLFNIADTNFKELKDLVGTNAEDGNYYYEYLYRPVVDVISRANDTGIWEETVKLNRYYEFYPLTFQFHAPDRNIRMEGSLNDALEEILRIPVPEEHQVTVTIENNWRGGMVTHAEVARPDDRPVSIYELKYSHVLTEDALYLLIHNQINGEKPLDFSQFKEGYGIYRVLLQNDGATKVMDIEDMSNCFTIDEGNVMTCDLKLNQEQDELILLTVENDELWMTFIDLETMEVSQKVKLTDSPIITYLDWTTDRKITAVETVRNTFVYETFIVVHTTGNRMILVTKTDALPGDDVWKPEWIVSADALSTGSLSLKIDDSTKFDWDGNRLALAIETGIGELERSMKLSVFTEEGMQFLADYGTEEEQILHYVVGDRDYYTRRSHSYRADLAMQEAVPVTIHWE